METGDWMNPFPPGSWLYMMAEIWHYKPIDPSSSVVQKVVSPDQLNAQLAQGWIFVTELQSGAVVVQFQLDLTNVTSEEDLEARLKPLGAKLERHDSPPAGAHAKVFDTLQPVYRGVTWRCFILGGKTICYQIPSLKGPPPHS
jgi:hypothetical protein